MRLQCVARFALIFGWLAVAKTNIFDVTPSAGACPLCATRPGDRACVRPRDGFERVASYDESDLPGFYMAIGTSGNQFKNAPVAGAMMSELIIACEQGCDHDRDPLPFHLERAGRTISIGFFSRRRRINPESSFWVLG